MINLFELRLFGVVGGLLGVTLPVQYLKHICFDPKLHLHVQIRDSLVFQLSLFTVSLKFHGAVLKGIRMERYFCLYLCDGIAY